MSHLARMLLPPCSDTSASNAAMSHVGQLHRLESLNLAFTGGQGGARAVVRGSTCWAAAGAARRQCMSWAGQGARPALWVADTGQVCLGASHLNRELPGGQLRTAPQAPTTGASGG